MSVWLIVVFSAAVSTVADAVIFFRSEPLGANWLAGLYALWPALTLAWVFVYGIAALALAATAELAWVSTGIVSAAKVEPVTGPYCGRLVVTQFFTALVALLVLAALPLRIDAALLGALPGPVASHPALAAAGVLALAALLGWAVLAAAAWFGPAANSRRPAEGPELRLLQEILLLLRVRNAAGSPSENNSTSVAGQFEQELRPVLDAVKDLAAALSRLSSRLHHEFEELRTELRQAQADPAALDPAGTAEQAGQLRAAAAVLDATLARWHEIAEALPATTMLPTPIGGAEGASRLQVSSELQALLRDMNDAAE